MPTLSIKNVPESVLALLRERARRNHRSLQGELMVIVSQAAEPEAMTPTRPSTVSGGKSIEDIAAEHKARWKAPFSVGPSSTEIIRGDRDAR